MLETVHSKEGIGLPTEADAALAARMFRAMIAFVVLIVFLSAPFMAWRITAGLALGGILSLFNHHWLQSSVSDLIWASALKRTAGHSAWRYIFRYGVIGLVVAGAYMLGVVSLPATIIGLCSFVAAFFAEALRQFYIVIIRREEIT